MKKYKVEACVETLEQAVLAEKRGADRIELCSALHRDGLTPSPLLIRQVTDHVSIPVRVMIRPHEKGFSYSETDVVTMKQSIDTCKQFEVEGVVFGVLEKDGNRLDMGRLQELTGHAAPWKVTVHKAIDCCDDPLAELEQLKRIEGIDTVLTSGKSVTAVEGIPLLLKMLEQASDQLELLVCGGVTESNVDALHEILGAKFYHGKKIVGSLVS